MNVNVLAIGVVVFRQGGPETLFETLEYEAVVALPMAEARGQINSR